MDVPMVCHTYILHHLSQLYSSGLSMNILRPGDKWPAQKGFFTKRAGDLLPALGFMGGLYNFCNFVIIFSLI